MGTLRAEGKMKHLIKTKRREEAHTILQLLKAVQAVQDHSL